MLISFLALYGDVLFELTDYKGWVCLRLSFPGTLRSLVWEILLVVVTTEMDNHRVTEAGRKLWRLSIPISCSQQGHLQQVSQLLFSWVLNISNDADSTTSLSITFLCFTTLTVSKYYFLLMLLLLFFVFSNHVGEKRFYFSEALVFSRVPWTGHLVCTGLFCCNS